MMKKRSAAITANNFSLWRNGDSLPKDVQLLKKDNVKPVKSSFNEEGLI